MVIKRFVSTLIDLTLSFIPVLIAFSGRDLEEYYFLTSFIFYLFHTTIFLSRNPQSTFGEKVMKINVVSSDNINRLLKVLLRNLVFAILIFGPLIASNNIIELLFMSIIPFISLIPISTDENSGEKVNGIDILFKTHYKSIIK